MHKLTTSYNKDGENNQYNFYNKLQLYTLCVSQSCCKVNN